MKTLIFALSTLLFFPVFCQTKAIAHKSHSGSPESFKTEDGTDNFGLAPKTLDTVKLLPNKCVVEIPNYGQNDTVCNHPYFTKNYTIEEIKGFYPKKTVLLGLENYRPKMKKPVKSKQNSLVYLFVITALISGILSTKRILAPVKVKKA